MSNKIKILVCGDNTLANTGYARFKYEILNHLYFERSEFEVAEYAYCLHSQMANRLPWKTYTSLKHHGRNEWDSVIIDFQPDLVFSPLDYYMWEYQGRSVFKDRYSLIVAPAFDRGPLPGACVGALDTADVVYGITKFGKQIMENKGIPVRDVIPIPINDEVFKPIEDSKHKFGLEKKTIYGFVGRNQTRKRIPELIEGFAQFLKTIDNPSGHMLFYHGHITESHESWNLASFLARNNLLNNFLLTYVCVQTKEIQILPFQDIGFIDDGGRNWVCANSEQSSIDSKSMAMIYGVMDYYIQASRSEGFGMPMIEAALCGTPAFAIDGSCMAEYTGKDGFVYPLVHTSSKQALADGSSVDIVLAEDFADMFYRINKETSKYCPKSYKHKMENVLKRWTKEFLWTYKHCERNSWEKMASIPSTPSLQNPTASELIRVSESGFEGECIWYQLREMYEMFNGRMKAEAVIEQNKNKKQTLQNFNQTINGNS